jgi:hypothetical protein
MKKLTPLQKARKKWKIKHGIENQRKYRKNHPWKTKARDVINNAIKASKLKRGSCILCGKKPKTINKKNIVHAHHPNYLQPLAIIWLCRDCHRKQHIPIHR